jgi:hypothetical protein
VFLVVDGHPVHKARSVATERKPKARPRSFAGNQEAMLAVALAEVRHGTAEFCDFDVESGGSLCLYNLGFRKSDVVQTYPLEAI